jgi:3',5'-cyclic AMP phosphodiesterase CpdA
MKTSRKGFLRSALAAGALSMVPGKFIGASNTIVSPTRKRSMRLAHFTDVHLQPEGAAPYGFKTALHEVQNMDDKPEAIIFSGDNIMDSFSHSRERTKTQWDFWNKMLKDECSLPIHPLLGNHDVFGWGLLGKYKKDDHYGKQWAVEELKIPKRYYSYDLNGWHFIMLDSTFKHGSGYKGKLDDEQKDWLKEELKKTPESTPICIVSHIPIYAMCVFMDGKRIKNDNWNVPGGLMHVEALELKDLFHQHKNVKLCLSGHIHLQDAVEYLGVKYLCNGAVCGGWWGGNNQEFAPAYAIIDFYDDGTIEYYMREYKWKEA